jgi:hypothetical protein
MQETTGRVGPEYLIVQDERLATAEPADRDKFEHELRSQLDSLEGLITNEIDWERKSELVVDHPRISELQQDWERRLGERKVSTDPGTKSTWVTVGIVVGLLLLGLLVFQQLGRRADRQDGAARFVREVATVVGVPVAQDDDSRTLNEVLTRLEQDLFVLKRGPASTHKGQYLQQGGASAAARHAPDEQRRFEYVITRFYRFVFPGKDATRFDDLIRDEGILNYLKLLYPKGRFDPLGLVDSKSTSRDPVLRSLRTVDADSFHNIVACMGKLQDAISKSKWTKSQEKGDKYDNFLHSLNDSVRRLPAPLGDDQECVPRFYRDEDAKAGQNLKALLTTLEALELLDPMPPIPEDLPSVLSEFGGQNGKGKSGDLLSPQLLEGNRARWNERSPEREVFDRLDDFVKACSQLRCNPAPTRERDR